MEDTPKESPIVRWQRRINSEVPIKSRPLSRDFRIDFDHSLRVDFLRLDTLPDLYMDDVTLKAEVYDLTTLRRGDHLFSSIHPALGCSYYIDLFMSWVSSLDLWPFTHHYVVMQDVATVDVAGIPRTSDGQEVMIAEYSNTPQGAISTLRDQGLMPLLNDFCEFKLNPLVTYFPVGCRGVWRLAESLSEEERDLIVENATEMMKTYAKYSPFTANCEHAIFALNPLRHEWSSPQVPFFFRNAVHVGFMLVGIWMLSNNNLVSWIMFHVFTTFTCICRVLLDLQVKTMRLTENRAMYGWQFYNFMIHRDVAKYSFALLCYVTTQYAYSNYLCRRSPLESWALESLYLGSWSVCLVVNFYFWRASGAIVVRILLNTSVFMFGGIPVFTVRSVTHRLTSGKKAS